ncbi:hypothetical protein PI93_003765 [Pandoraea fibrosis]|uniref:Neuromedin U n=2 Tax=Pandoraea fibrosis TaxID=1891094 RepID=A0ABX6HLX0_9BURK|nr:hypothetical protein PJ20_003765 [Pandoraea fibrosis]QHF11862.1 hypothetical protein PI93_003765 [Pandoraea fibrosis]
MLKRCIMAVLVGSFCQSALSQSADDANKSNNPLNLATSLNFQNYYTPRLFDTRAHTNDFLVRPTLPIAPGGLIGYPQILRMTVPISTRPAGDGGYTTGLGDINLFDILLLKQGELDIGVGPLITLPTATSRELGTGKWSGGLAAVAVHASKEGLLGGLVQWQHSFAGQSQRETVHTATLQPFIIRNLPQGWYLRSTGTWTFDVQKNNYDIPLGLGVGKAWRVGKDIFNAFVEPQWTVAHKGEGVPQFTVFAGLNITFGK